MKFTLDITLADRIDTERGVGISGDFTTALLAIDGVASVFGVNDFVTIIREPSAHWDPIVCAVEAAADTYLTDEHSATPATDAVAVARQLLRNAVVPPPKTAVDISRRTR